MVLWAEDKKLLYLAVTLKTITYYHSCFILFNVHKFELDTIIASIYISDLIELTQMRHGEK